MSPHHKLLKSNILRHVFSQLLNCSWGRHFFGFRPSRPLLLLAGQPCLAMHFVENLRRQRPDEASLAPGCLDKLKLPAGSPQRDFRDVFTLQGLSTSSVPNSADNESITTSSGRNSRHSPAGRSRSRGNCSAESRVGRSWPASSALRKMSTLARSAPAASSRGATTVATGSLRASNSTFPAARASAAAAASGVGRSSSVWSNRGKARPVETRAITSNSSDDLPSPSSPSTTVITPRAIHGRHSQSIAFG